MSEKAMTLSERLRAPKAWMAWHDFGAVTIAGDPIPAMDHDSQAPREAADALDAKDARIKELSRIVYLFVEAEDDYRAKSINASQYNDRIRDWTDRAREALNALEP